MKKTFLHLIFLLLSLVVYSQNNKEKLMELGKAYKNFMFVNNPTDDYIKSLKSDMPNDLKTASDFILQAINPKTKIIEKKYLTLPDDQTLKNIYIIRAVNYNLHDKEPVSNEQIVDSLMLSSIPRNEMIDAYSGMLFTSYGNKVKPFDMEKINFQLGEYNFKNDTEKGIFFLRCMEFCGKNIWGFINIAKPMNTKKAYEYVQVFPRFNGFKYFQYNDFNFPDFQMVIVKDKGIQSYKEYFIDKYYETLLNHLLCLKKENRPEKEYHELLLGSILRDKDLYPYSKKYKEVLENLFKTVKKD